MRKALMKNFIWITSLLLIGTSQGFCDPYPAYKRSDEVGFSINGDFLYWYWNLGEKDYAVRQEFTATGTLLNDIFFIDPDWRPGFRLQGEYRFSTPWDLITKYTFIRLKGSGSIDGPDILDTLTPGVGALDFARSFLTVHYHVFDLALARVVQPRESLVFRYTFGARIPWMKQRWKNLYQLQDNAPPHLPLGSVRSNWDLVGGGPTIGAEGKWNYYDGLYILGSASCAVVYTRTKVRMLAVFANPPTSNDANLNERAHKINPMVDMSLAFGWNSSDSNDARVNLAIGGEIAYWWNVDEQIRRSPTAFFDHIRGGALSLMGIFVRGGIDY